MYRVHKRSNQLINKNFYPLFKTQLEYSVNEAETNTKMNLPLPALQALNKAFQLATSNQQRQTILSQAKPLIDKLKGKQLRLVLDAAMDNDVASSNEMTDEYRKKLTIIYECWEQREKKT